MSEKASTLVITPEAGESDEAAVARVKLQPPTQAGISIHLLNDQSALGTDLNSLIEELSAQVEAVANDDLARSEAMLVAQASTLDAMFHAMLRRAALNLGHYPEVVERYMKLALKAQNQCRTTLEAVSSIKNPPTYVGQANIAQNQQVNNHPAKPENELLEHEHGERLDFGATQTPIRDDSAMETVGAINRTEDSEGKSQGGQELG